MEETSNSTASKPASADFATKPKSGCFRSGCNSIALKQTGLEGARFIFNARLLIRRTVAQNHSTRSLPLTQAILALAYRHVVQAAQLAGSRHAHLRIGRALGYSAIGGLGDHDGSLLADRAFQTSGRPDFRWQTSLPDL